MVGWPSPYTFDIFWLAMKVLSPMPPKMKPSQYPGYTRTEEWIHDINGWDMILNSIEILSKNLKMNFVLSTAIYCSSHPPQESFSTRRVTCASINGFPPTRMIWTLVSIEWLFRGQSGYSIRWISMEILLAPIFLGMSQNWDPQIIQPTASCSCLQTSLCCNGVGRPKTFENQHLPTVWWMIQF